MPHRYKPTWLTAISSRSRCITCQDVCVQQLGKTATTVTWSEPLKTCHVTVTQQRLIVEPAFAAKEQIKWASVSSLHYVKRVNWFLCSVSVISANKLSLQELTQLIGIELPISRFLEICFLSPNFQGGNARFAPLRTPMNDLHWMRMARKCVAMQTKTFEKQQRRKLEIP